MSQLLIQIIGGVIVAVIAALFGIGGTTRVTVHSGVVRKTGKWIIIISVLMIMGGIALLNKQTAPNDIWKFNTPGSLLIGYGILFFIVGKIVAWYQRP